MNPIHSMSPAPGRCRRSLPLLAAALALTVGCATSRAVATRGDAAPAATPAAPERSDPLPEAACAGCDAQRVGAELAGAIEKRLADLKARGGTCAQYAAVLESSYRSGQITLRPYMWRVGEHLASGEARPDGRMVLAREIDSLNVGVRTVDDVLWTLEHEAAHIAFRISNGADAESDRANAAVRACRG